MPPAKTALPKLSLAAERVGQKVTSQLLVSVSAAFLLMTGPAWANDTPDVTYGLWGNPGLIDMPTAQMAPDGTFSVGASYFKNTQHYNFNFQALPWLEASFRYSGIAHLDPSYPVYWDRSLAIKVRLVRESNLLPDISIGVNDVVGTGVYSSEYIAVTKSLGSITATAGLGWGRLSNNAVSKNPLAEIKNSFATRPTLTNWGQSNLNIFFHGPSVGAFGGLTWNTPIRDLIVKTEYSSDQYRLESSGTLGASNGFKPKNQFNYGAEYKLTDSTSIGLSWLYGKTLALNLNLAANVSQNPYPERLGEQPPTPELRTPDGQQDALNLMMDTRKNGHYYEAVRLTSKTNNDLIDDIWVKNKNIKDISLRGKTIIVSVDAADFQKMCDIVGKYSSATSLKIDAIQVSDGERKKNCPVNVPVKNNQQSDPIFLNASFNAAAMPDINYVTIDATSQSGRNSASAIEKTKAGAQRQGLIIQAAEIKGATATIYYSNVRYFSEDDAVNRLTRVLMNAMPPEVEQFRLIATLGGLPQKEFDVLRSQVERGIVQENTVNLAKHVQLLPAPLNNPVLTKSEAGTYPRHSWYFFPAFRQEFFDPDRPLGLQFVVGAAGTVELMPGLSLEAVVEATLYGNFNTLRPAGSDLPHVRTDFLEYYSKGGNGIGALTANYRYRITPEITAIVRAGYLESMYAGAGGEVLWRPLGERWAIGADLYEVQKRGFDRLFDLQNYRIMTGHVSLYYASPWYQINAALRVGRYLAGDRGYTLELTRRFSTGVEIGAFFTKTNVTAEQFGEGSFDKGFILRFPIGYILPVNTQAEVGMDIRPVQRDGGQRLWGDAILYGHSRRTSNAEFTNVVMN